MDVPPIKTVTMPNKMMTEMIAVKELAPTFLPDFVMK